jgi:hypothetical protein
MSTENWPVFVLGLLVGAAVGCFVLPMTILLAKLPKVYDAWNKGKESDND